MTPAPTGPPRRARRRASGLVAPVGAALVAAAVALLLGPIGAAGAQQSPTTTAPAAASTTGPAATGPATTAPAGTDTTVDPAQVAKLQKGAQVFSQICSACHQPGGAGLPGQYPPLLNNPNVQNTDYITGVINNGKQGPLTVLGQSYNGVMPAFSTLGAEDIAAVVAYVQAGLKVPGGATATTEALGPVAGTELPALANMSSLVAFLLAAAVVLGVLGPRFASVNSRLSTPWLDAWLKTAVIVAAVVLLVVVIPNWALHTTPVSKLSRTGQDVIGVGLWGGGLLAVLGGLWYAHREQRI